MLVAAVNQEKALVGACSVITKLRMDLFEALMVRQEERLLEVMVGDPPQCAGHIMEEVKSDSELQAQYIARNPVSRVIQCAAVQSENEVSAGTHIQ